MTRRAFSLVELLILIAVMSVLLAIVLASVGRSRDAVQSTVCLTQLSQIHSAFTQYSNQNHLVMPDPVATGVSWEASLAPYLGGGAAVFLCPADREVGPATGSSYDWRDTGDPATTLAGRRLDETQRRDAVLSFESLPDWHERGRINMVSISGSARTMNATACFRDLQTSLKLGAD